MMAGGIVVWKIGYEKHNMKFKTTGQAISLNI
jgi:hypothetical protein